MSSESASSRPTIVEQMTLNLDQMIGLGQMSQAMTYKVGQVKVLRQGQLGLEEQPIKMMISAAKLE